MFSYHLTPVVFIMLVIIFFEIKRLRFQRSSFALWEIRMSMIWVEVLSTALIFTSSIIIYFLIVLLSY